MEDAGIAARGAEFLVANVDPNDVFTPEDLTENDVMIARTCEEFVAKSVLPRLEEMEQGDHRVTVELLREAGRLGILGGDVPEAYGGLGLQYSTTTVIIEKMARGASFAVSFGGHTGIGTLPIVFFGTEEQKARYLPALASGEKLAAYALTEPEAGSDAMGGKTTARLSDDGRTYRLSGQKQWITNSGFADIFIVYAKVDGDKMTAFIVERGFSGLSVSPEVHKMGLQGSSTCMVFLDDVPVPVENVLGDVGRGHVVAFNVLNSGRWKLAGGCLGSCKVLLEVSAKYAAQRSQFGRPIAQFPAIRQKLAQMASRTFALESTVYRTAGLLDRRLHELREKDAAPGEAQAGEASRRDATALAMREYAVECSINKVFGSEVLDRVVDESVQIHGGYGYIRGFAVERAYRDARINRIFEGTNEINRLLMPGMVLQKATRGELPLLDAARQVQQEVAGAGLVGSQQMPMDGLLAEEQLQLANLKRATLLVAGLGTMKYLARVEEEQEFLLSMADLAILVFALESTLLRVRRLEARLGADATAAAADLARLFSSWALDQGEITARRALASIDQGDALQAQLAIIRRLFRRTPVDERALGRRIADRVLAAGGYPEIAQRAAQGRG